MPICLLQHQLAPAEAADVDKLVAGGRQHDVAALGRDRDRLGDGTFAAACDVDHHVDTLAAAVVHDLRDHVFSLDIDRVVGAPLLGDLKRRASRPSPLTMMHDAPAALAAMTQARPC